MKEYDEPGIGKTIEVVVARKDAAGHVFTVHVKATPVLHTRPVPFMPLAAAVVFGMAIFTAFAWAAPRARGVSAFILIAAVAMGAWYAVLNDYFASAGKMEARASIRMESTAQSIIFTLPGSNRYLQGLAEDMSTGLDGRLDPHLNISPFNGVLKVNVEPENRREIGNSQAVILLPLLLLALLIYAWGATGRAGRAFSALAKHSAAYAYTAPAGLGMLMLVLAPFAFGIGLSFFRHSGGTFSFVGITNFRDILLSENRPITNPLSFYFTLLVTILWTAANVVLHVSIGLALALILKSPFLRMKAVYRVLLILPWAIPNYVTALIWKGMFNQQFGAINALLASLGLTGPDGVAWFSSFATAFTANLVTNTWLGFPFMMVVSLGALQSIPSELYEAAKVDGAGRWRRFRSITLPLLKPALFPAVILGSIWTFNQFNIIYLVSGGEPSGATDILITEAYRWAFERGDRYGYAAAYSSVIFVILLAYTLVTSRLTRATQSSMQKT
ncbi:MAG: sugar ABC transporter permease [Deltaproteobacteria bacterium]|nr:sugar ABC transporter permease [Deltaproteobacteria bacterium]